MAYNETTLGPQLRAFGAKRYFELDAAVAPLRFTDVGPVIVLAIGSRETNLQNIIGFSGTDHGLMQINDEAHGAWLAVAPGCVSGSWTPVPGHNAGERATPDSEAFVPTLADGVRMAMQILRYNNEAGIRLGLKGGALLRFEIAAYNAGVGGATKGLKAGNVDAETTKGNYSADVIDRWRALSSLIERWGWH
jgi:hypothetical protein